MQEFHPDIEGPLACGASVVTSVDFKWSLVVIVGCHHRVVRDDESEKVCGGDGSCVESLSDAAAGAAIKID